MATKLLDRVLLIVAGLIHQVTWRAWMQLARRSAIGELLARLRATEDRVAQLEAECGILRMRLEKRPPRSRPHYPKHARFEILYHLRRWGMTLKEAARIFLVTPKTLGRWVKKQEAGDTNLVSPHRPVNRLSDLKRELIHRLNLEQVSWGTRRICDLLVKLGLRLSRRSVQRILRERPAKPRPQPKAGCSAGGRPIVARYPMHVAMIDLTTVRIPFVREIWIGAVVDVFSRKVLSIRAWSRVPRAIDVRSLIKDAMRAFGRPRYVISDRGTQFTAKEFKRHLKRKKIRRRYGAVGKWQSVAVIDRFFGALKTEYAGRWMLFLATCRIEEHLRRYVLWHGRHRTHQGLGGWTPDEVFFARRRKQVPDETIGGIRLIHLAGDRRLSVYQRVRVA